MLITLPRLPAIFCLFIENTFDRCGFLEISKLFIITKKRRSHPWVTLFIRFLINLIILFHILSLLTPSRFFKYSIITLEQIYQVIISFATLTMIISASTKHCSLFSISNYLQYSSHSINPSSGHFPYHLTVTQ